MTTIDTTITATDQTTDDNTGNGRRLTGRPCYLPAYDQWASVTRSDDERGTIETDHGTYQRGAVIVLPAVGEYVSIVTSDGESIAGYWTDTHPLSLATDTAWVTLLDADARTVTRASVPVRNADERTCVSDRTRTLDLAAAVGMLTRNGDALANLVQAAHEQANEQGYCSQFDDFMEDNGLPRRSRSYELSVDVQLSNVWLTVDDATSEDNARDNITASMIVAALGADDIDMDTMEAELR